MLETWVRSLGWEDPLEKGTATHSSILAWRIPRTVVHGMAKNRTWLSDFMSLHFTRNKYVTDRSLGGLPPEHGLRGSRRPTLSMPPSGRQHVLGCEPVVRTWKKRGGGKDGADRRAGSSLWECPLLSRALAVVPGERQVDSFCEASQRGWQGSGGASGSMDQRHHPPGVNPLWNPIAPWGRWSSFWAVLKSPPSPLRWHCNLLTFSLSHELWPFHGGLQMLI